MTCPRPYSVADLSRPGIGGTETTVAHVATGLAAAGERVVIAQHNRTENCNERGVDYVRFEDIGRARRYSRVIVIRTAAGLEWARTRFKAAELFFWIHNPPDLIAQFASNVRATSPRVITNSKWHARITKSALSGARSKAQVLHVYNPIDDELCPDETPVRRNQLLFCSSPHKGLDLVLLHFQAASRELGDLELRITNPGYFRLDRDLLRSQPNIKLLGPLSHERVVREMRSSLCVFFPNFRVPETFGIIFAEANAVGTPVLAHRFGAAAEVLGDGEQVVDARSLAQTTERLRDWHRGSRPKVQTNPAFRFRNVLKRWQDVLNE
jgi:glycosyltransferase involved in cell wall biosynthesis